MTIPVMTPYTHPDNFVLCPDCEEEPWCLAHGQHFSECACLGMMTECGACGGEWESADGTQITCPACGGPPAQWEGLESPPGGP